MNGRQTCWSVILPKSSFVVLCDIRKFSAIQNFLFLFKNIFFTPNPCCYVLLFTQLLTKLNACWFLFLIKRRTIQDNPGIINLYFSHPLSLSLKNENNVVQMVNKFKSNNDSSTQTTKHKKVRPTNEKSLIKPKAKYQPTITHSHTHQYQVGIKRKWTKNIQKPIKMRKDHDNIILTENKIQFMSMIKIFWALFCFVQIEWYQMCLCVVPFRKEKL